MKSHGINKRILKVTSLFGGLQGATMLCSVVRTKLVAVWIGTAGVGLFGLLGSALETVFTITQLSLRQSAVRHIAASPPSQMPQMVCAVRRWAMWLGIAGALLTLICSPWLSAFTFGTTGNWWMFAALAITVFFSSANNCEGAVFQSLQRFGRLAQCSLAGTVGGLAVSIPMFYFWRINGIVPSLIAYYACTWIAMGLYRERVPAPEPPQSLRESFETGRRIITLGVYLTVTALVTNLVSYIFMAYLNNVGNLNLTGCYSAGFTLVNRYAGLIFTAISMEYFPRLSKVISSRARTSLFVTNQLFITLTIIVPVATLFIACSDIIIRLLYSSRFLVVEPFVIWGSVGTVLRAVAWCMSFVILARGDGRTFLLTEIASGTLSLLLNIAGYRLAGFTGLGFAYLAWFLCYSLIVAAVCLRRYRLRINRSILLYLTYAVILTTATAGTAHFATPLHALPFVPVAGVIATMIIKRLIYNKDKTPQV